MKISAYILISISIILFFNMVDTIIKRIGIQSSISYSYYKLKANKWLITFSLVSFSMFLLLGYCLLNYNLLEEGNYRDILFIFFACLGICYTGAAAAYKKDSLTNTFHLVGVYIGVALGYLYLGFNFQFHLIAISMTGVFFSHRYSKENYTFYDEIIAFTAIVYGILENSLLNT